MKFGAFVAGGPQNAALVALEAWAEGLFLSGVRERRVGRRNPIF